LNLKLRKEDCARAIWERVEPKGFVKEDEILVHLTNITYGWKTRVPDRGDSDEIHWEVRDPLANVLFFNPKDERDRGYRVGTDHVSGLFLPRATQERVLYCYFKGDPADDAKLRALAAVRYPNVEMHFLCAQLGAGVLLNISAKFWRISSPDCRVVGYRTSGTGQVLARQRGPRGMF